MVSGKAAYVIFTIQSGIWNWISRRFFFKKCKFSTNITNSLPHFGVKYRKKNSIGNVSENLFHFFSQLIWRLKSTCQIILANKKNTKATLPLYDRVELREYFFTQLISNLLLFWIDNNLFELFCFCNKILITSKHFIFFLPEKSHGTFL